MATIEIYESVFNAAVTLEEYVEVKKEYPKLKLVK